MSRIGRAPIQLPANVKLEVKADNAITITGPKGSLSHTFSPMVKVEKNETSLTVTRVDDSKEAKSLHGLSRTLLANMVQGVSAGFSKGLELQGTGYRVTKAGNNLIFAVGYSHPVFVVPPEGISFAVEGPTKLTISGIDKQLVGQVAANIRSIRKPEPYKGKGIRYAGEVVRMKAGKAGKVGKKK
jgi:large subunit ribosomal protein L6